jgi:hypothetical protein
VLFSFFFILSKMKDTKSLLEIDVIRKYINGSTFLVVCPGVLKGVRIMKRKTFITGLFSLFLSICTALAQGQDFSATQSVNEFWDQSYSDLAKQISAHKALAKSGITGYSKEAIIDTQALILSEDRDPLDVLLRRTQALLDNEKKRSLTAYVIAFQRKLDNIKGLAGFNGLAKSTITGQDSVRKELFMKVSALHRAAVFNAAIDFDTLLFYGWHRSYWKESWLAGENSMLDEYFPWRLNFTAGNGLYMLKGLKSSNPVLIDVLKNSTVQKGRLSGSNLTGGAFLSPDLSYDGKTILFSWTNAQENCWHIFKVNTDGSNLIQLTDGKDGEMFSGYNDSRQSDMDPCWLPNGRIVFISDRRGGFGRCHESNVKPTWTLYSMKDDGSDLYCISYHETNEWQPSISNDGRIAYTRWDYLDRDDNIAHHLWTCDPDGCNPRAPHGNYPIPQSTMSGSGWPDGRWFRPNGEWQIRAIPGTSKYVAVASGHHVQTWGHLVIINPDIEDDNKMSQLKGLTTNRTTWCDCDSSYSTPWPLSEDYYLCNKNNSIILRDKFGGEEVIYNNNNWISLDPIPVRSRQKPPVLTTRTWQGERSTLPDHMRATMGVVNVYNSDIPLPSGTKIKSMRIVQVVPKTTWLIDNPRVGYSAEMLVRMSLGTVPVESDGSVYCEAPIAREVYFQLLDSLGCAVQTMRSGAYFHAGEQISCAGCHENKWKAVPPPSTVPIAFQRAPSKITPDAGGLEPVNFYRLVKPVFDAKCAPCHKQQGKGPDMSYGSLKNYAFYWSGNGNPWLNGDIMTAIKGGSRSTPGKIGARAASLYSHLFPSHQNVNLTNTEFKRITLWLDCNSLELGSYESADEQKLGKLIWPLADIDTTNLQSVETKYPVPGVVDIRRIFGGRSLEDAQKRSVLSLIEIKNGVLTLYDKNASPVKVFLFDLQGRTVAEILLSGTVPVNLRETTISRGTYIVHAISRLTSQTFRFTIDTR